MKIQRICWYSWKSSYWTEWALTLNIFVSVGISDFKFSCAAIRIELIWRNKTGLRLFMSFFASSFHSTAWWASCSAHLWMVSSCLQALHSKPHYAILILNVSAFFKYFQTLPDYPVHTSHTISYNEACRHLWSNTWLKFLLFLIDLNL